MQGSVFGLNRMSGLDSVADSQRLGLEGLHYVYMQYVRTYVRMHLHAY